MGNFATKVDTMLLMNIHQCNEEIRSRNTRGIYCHVIKETDFFLLRFTLQWPEFKWEFRWVDCIEEVDVLWHHLSLQVFIGQESAHTCMDTLGGVQCDTTDWSGLKQLKSVSLKMFVSKLLLWIRCFWNAIVTATGVFSFGLESSDPRSHTQVADLWINQQE